MPLTFPAHAAAILPLLHLPGTRRLSARALVLGSTAPDLIYLVGVHGADAHRPLGLLQFCLPAGLLAFVYLEALLLPVLGPLLLTLLPRFWQRASILSPRPLPATLTGWLAVSLAILLGAATHQLWDGFTHAWMWPARSLYPGVALPILGHRVLLSRVLQHTSSVAGVVVVLGYLRWVLPRSTPSESPDRAGAAQRLRRLFLWPRVGGIAAGAVRLQQPDPLFSRALWDAGWAAVAWFALLLGAACLWARAGGTARPGT
jgi:hypothetical protein